MPPPFVLAQISDVHLGPLPRFRPRHWNAKRVLGFINWHRNRRSAHLGSALDRILADLELQQPDHIAVTGDLVNIGLPEEYAAAKSWLASLGDPGRITMVPGNHDIYTHLGSEPGAALWHAYMTSQPPVPAPDGHGSAQSLRFPFVRRLGPVALVGLNSAHPTPPFVASGVLGPGQIAEAARLLRQLGADGVARVVLIHHPPLPGQASRAKALADAPAMAAMLADAGAELVIHGHNHRRSVVMAIGPGARAIPVVGVPSASLAVAHGKEDLARYHLYRFRPGEPVELVARGLAHSGGPVVEIERRRLD